MFFDSIENRSKKIAEEIENLVELQMIQSPFSEIQLTSVDILRAKICLAIYDFAYLIFFVNSFMGYDTKKVQPLIDKTYDFFYLKFQSKNHFNSIKFSEIIVNPNEQKEIIKILPLLNIYSNIDLKSLKDILFPKLFEYRIPKYLKAMSIGMQNAEKDIVMPYLPIVHLFSDQFLKEHNSDFAVIFDFCINLETFKRVLNIVQQNT
ncbi:MAG: hypothetical protein IT276_15625 [Ignavibacteriaceae bacterium]|nr:hypothetical protein [Ignavibacteriaceae bacterium]